MNWVAAYCLWKQPLSTERYGYAYMPTFANTHSENIQHDLPPSSLYPSHTLHSVCHSHSLVSVGQSIVEERARCRRLLRFWNKAKVQGCNTSREHRGPPPTGLRLEVGLPVRLKLKIKRTLGNRLEMGLPKGLRIVLVFYNCSREVVWE